MRDQEVCIRSKFGPLTEAGPGLLSVRDVLPLLTNVWPIVLSH